MVLYILDVAVLISAWGTLIAAGWSIAVPCEDRNSFPWQIVDPDAGGIQGGRIGVTRRKSGRSVAKVRAVRFWEGVEQRLEGCKRVLARGERGNVCYPNMRLAHSQPFVRAEKE